MKETCECQQCGGQFDVVRHPLKLTVCPTCEAEVRQVKRQAEGYARARALSRALSWIAIVCGLAGMVLALLAYLK